MSDGQTHQSIMPLKREFVDATVQLLHCDGLWVQDVGMDGLVEFFGLSCLMEVSKGRGQNLV